MSDLQRSCRFETNSSSVGIHLVWISKAHGHSHLLALVKIPAYLGRLFRKSHCNACAARPTLVLPATDLAGAEQNQIIYIETWRQIKPFWGSETRVIQSTTLLSILIAFIPPAVPLLQINEFPQTYCPDWKQAFCLEKSNPTY